MNHSNGNLGSVHEGCRGCPTVFAAGRWVPWVLCTKAAVAAPQSLLQVVGFHGFCARRLPWLPHSFCCRSLGSVYEGCRGCPAVCCRSLGSVYEGCRGCPTVSFSPQATADARGCRVEGMPAAHVLSCHAAAGLSLRRVFFLRTSSARGSGLAKANVRERTQSVGGLSGWLCSQGTSRRCDPPRSAGAVREDFAVVCQFKRRGRPRAGSQWRNTSLVLCGAAPLAFDVHLSLIHI